MDEQDDHVDTGRLESVRLAVGGRDDVLDDDTLDAGRGDQLVEVFGDGPDEADLDAVHLLDEGGLQELGRRGAGLVDVGADVLPLGARNDSVDQVVPTLVELVVAHCRDVETRLR